MHYSGVPGGILSSAAEINLYLSVNFHLMLSSCLCISHTWVRVIRRSRDRVWPGIHWVTVFPSLLCCVVGIQNACVVPETLLLSRWERVSMEGSAPQRVCFLQCRIWVVTYRVIFSLFFVFSPLSLPSDLCCCSRVCKVHPKRSKSMQIGTASA